MVILGISGGASLGNQDGSAVIMINGKVVFAQEEERFKRLKHSVSSFFNVKGEPIVNTPVQALATFFSTGMDALFIGNFYLKKK